MIHPVMEGVREYREEYAVELGKEGDRFVVVATNEGSNNSTAIDLLDLLEWVRANRPELLAAPTGPEQPEGK
jgi:hypothetical protein